MKRQTNEVYRRRQMILLICIALIIIAAMIFFMYIFIFRDKEEIGNGTEISSSAGSTEAIPADIQDNNDDNNKIRFEEDEITIKVGEKYTPKVIPSDSMGELFSWESLNNAVAVVSQSGEITGISEGSCVITVCVRNTDVLLEIKVNIIPDEDEHEIVVENGLTYIDGILMANKSYSMPADYDPGVNQEALDAFNEMAADAASEGLDIYISSGYRSYDDQERIYNNYVERDGQEAADTYSSRPGHSDHQTGLAFDLNSIDDSFGLTPESDWVAANAHKYGFIIRFPEGKEDITGYQYEPWHIRYLGVEKATEVYESGLCLEEFLGVDSVYKD